MLLLRIAGVLAAIVIASGIVAFLFSRDRRYLTLSWRVFKYLLVLCLAVLTLFFLERIVVL